MPSIQKVLGQAAPSTTNNTNLYTVPANTSAVSSTLSVTNTTTAIATARVFVRIGGDAAGQNNAIMYDVAIQPNSVIALTIGMTLAETDIVTVQTGTADALTFMLFGEEIY